jgi:spore coat protein A
MTRPVSRRVFIGGAVAGVVAVGVGVPLVLQSRTATSAGNLLVSEIPIPRAFTRPLKVPPVLKPVKSDATADYYTITQRQIDAEVIPGHRTALWTYNGSLPGPTIESRSGRTAIVKHINRLPLPTVVHLHGGRTPHDSDGYPTDFIYPVDMSYLDQREHDSGSMASMSGMSGMSGMVGDVTHGSRTYTYPLEQRATTLWYHDHRMDFTGPSVWRGLAGFHLVRDDEEDGLKLPSGSRELPLMIMDRSFAADGSLQYPSVDPSLVNTPGVTGDFVAGVLGDVMLVNGTPWPTGQVDRAHYRLRILNASNARRLSLRLDPAPPGGFTQIGTDGGLLSAPIPQDHLELAPAQRFDVVVDFSGYTPGTKVTLVNDFGSGAMSKVMQFVVGDNTDDSFVIPQKLSTIVPLTAEDAVVTRSFRFQTGDIGSMKGWLINGEPFTTTAIAATVKLGTVEVWQLFADAYHPVHLHLSPFHVLSRGTGGPGPFDAGWKDTIDLHPGEQAQIAIRFDGYAGKYVFHCHILEHEDMAMMANFQTVE